VVMPLPAPTMCSLQLVSDLVAERQNGVNAAFFAGIAAEWRVRVQAYVDACGCPSLVQPWPAIVPKKKSFLNLYGAPADGSVQGAMLQTLRKHDLTLCPACGEAGRPNTLDHYLPKRKYPHFCVTPLNLFPMCDACQAEKHEKTGDAHDPRFFLHPYFDVFIAEQVLAVTIYPPFDAPTFDLKPRLGLAADQTMLVASHIRELAIPQRYAHFFRGQHRRLLRLVQKMRVSDQDVAETLETFRSGVERPSSNSWEYIFYTAVLETPELVTYLKEGALPAYT
jgi:hypothetical protein